MDRFTGIHAVREALEAGSAFERIVIAKGRQDSRVEEIVQLARSRGITVRFEDRGQLDRLAKPATIRVSSPSLLLAPPSLWKTSSPTPINPNHSAASSSCSTVSRIPTIWAPSFAPPSPLALTELSSPSTVPLA